MMTKLGLFAVGTILAVQPSLAEAQVTISRGNPYTGTGPSITIGSPAGGYYGQPGYAQGGYAQPGYAQGGYAQPGYAQGGYAQPGYVVPGAVAPGYQQQGVYPGYEPRIRGQARSSTTYYNSGYRGYSSSAPSYEQGYYGSNYVTPGQTYSPAQSGTYYSQPGGTYYSQPGGTYYQPRY